MLTGTFQNLGVLSIWLSYFNVPLTTRWVMWSVSHLQLSFLKTISWCPDLFWESKVKFANLSFCKMKPITIGSNCKCSCHWATTTPMKCIQLISSLLCRLQLTYCYIIPCPSSGWPNVSYFLTHLTPNHAASNLVTVTNIEPHNIEICTRQFSRNFWKERAARKEPGRSTSILWTKYTDIQTGHTLLHGQENTI